MNHYFLISFLCCTFILSGCSSDALDSAINTIDNTTEKISDISDTLEDMKDDASDLAQSTSEAINPQILLYKNKTVGSGENKVKYNDIFEQLLTEPTWETRDGGEVVVFGGIKSPTLLSTYGFNDTEDASMIMLHFTFNTKVDQEPTSTLSNPLLFRIFSIGGDLVNPSLHETKEFMTSLHKIYISEKTS